MVVAMAAEVRAVEVRGAMRAVEATVEEAKVEGVAEGRGLAAMVGTRAKKGSNRSSLGS